MLSRRARRTLAVVGCAALAACSGGTTPTRPAPPPWQAPPSAGTTAPPDPAAARVAAMSLEQQVGQLLLPQIYGSSATEVTPAQARANQALLGVATPAEAIRRYSLGGVTLLGQNTTDPVFADLPTGNVENPKQLRNLTDGLSAARADGDDLPLVIAIDQEGGVVDRLRAPATEMPAAMAVGATGDPENARAAAAVTAAELRAVGVTVDLAPVADLASLPTNTVIGTRSYGADPTTVGRYVTAAVQGLQDAGVAATLKHFPGHGGTDVDSHLRLPTLPQSRAQLDAADLVPFRAGIDGGADLVMTGNLRVPAIDGSSPASLSKPLITDVLRGQLGFRGVVITDALSMGAIRQGYSPGEAAVRAVDAGADLLSISANTAEARTALLAAVASGRLARQTVVDAATRVVRLRMSLARGAQPPITSVGSAEHRAVAARVAAASVTALTPVAPVGPGVQVLGRGSAALAEALSVRGATPGTGTRLTVVGSGDRAAASSATDVAVGTGTPWVLARSPARTKLTAYGDVPASIGALADVLTGRATARGRVPVPLG